ncbi:Hypothetical protein, putative [Bodo saltans]|uniref:Uncharacterized protein n=1 Tax=Bodo saltans TaxID=75058 RepID=A0A0S4JUZ6_BODSA|nr:Hypothetical protein, putative [Bodo saltans]|eukprot:CUG94043.1 Hypothetical protein, putative [Bodo saltans]
MFSWVTKLATEVQQFGENCIESIVGDEEEAPPTATSSTTAAASSPRREGEDIEDDGSPQSPDRGEEGAWAPTELRFVGKQTQALASLGWGIVEKGAAMTLSLLGEEEGSPEQQRRQSTEREEGLFEVASHLKQTEAPQSVAATADEHPLEKLRACRGYLGMLRRQLNTTVDDTAAPRVVASQTIVPSAIAELDYSEDLFQDCMWVEGSMVGRRIVTTRKLLSSPLDEESGERLEDAAIVAALPKFKQMSTDACDAIARMVAEELAETFARPSRSLNSTLSELLLAHRAEQDDVEDRGAAAYWFLHQRVATPGLALNVAKNVVDLTIFAFCEMHHAADALCKLAQEGAAWARRTDHADAKAIKEQSMTVRGECLSSNVEAIVMLEEVLEIVLSLFPQDEGAMPLEPLRMGQPLEFVVSQSSAVQIVETEVGEVEVESADRHSRAHHARITLTPKPSKSRA